MAPLTASAVVSLPTPIEQARRLIAFVAEMAVVSLPTPIEQAVMGMANLAMASRGFPTDSHRVG